MRKKIGILILVSFAVSFNSLWAYHGDVHKKIDEYAVDPSNSRLDQVLREQLGIVEGVDAELKRGNESKTIKEWIAFGGKAEDYGVFGEHDFGTTRGFNHFHDPLKGWDEAGFNKPGLNELYYAAYARYSVSAILWGLKAGEQDFLRNFTGDWSWGKARDCYCKALTEVNEDQRNRNFADCFRALGQVMHLLQDASVPLHTRNDLHVCPIKSIALTKLGLPLYLGKWTYETFTQEYRDHLDYTAHPPDQVLLTDPQPDQNYSNIVPISGLFDRNQYKRGDPIPLLGDLIGLAEYSNANFVTHDTMWEYQHPNLPDTNFDRIDWLNPEQIDAEDGVVDNRLYIRKEVGEQIAHFAVLDYWSREYQGHEEHIPGAYSLDKVCWNDYQKKLIPSAVGYSAALLDYFFRGKLEVEFVGDGLNITNKSGETMRDGYFELYYDSAEGERQAIEISFGGEVTELAPNAEQIITFVPPSDFGEDEHYLLVYRGVLGNETDAVVGKVVADEIGYVYVAIGHSGYTERCIVWDPKENDYAELTNPNTGSLMSFPCSKEDIQWWIDRTSSVSNGALYSFVKAGEDAIVVQEGSETSANTGCGVHTNTTHKAASTQIGPGQMCFRWERTTTTRLAAILSYLLGSWNLTILNDVGGTTCVRTTLDYDFSGSGSYGDPDYCSFGLTQSASASEEWTRQTITPPGNLLAITATRGYYIGVGLDETCTQNVTNEIVSQWGRWGNAYSDRVMVQIYVDHVIIRDTTGSDSKICDPYYLYCTPDSLQEISRSRVTGVKAACDFYDDANAADPRMQNANVSFTSAVDGLIADFYEVNGIAGDMLCPENTQLDVDIRR